MKQSKKNSQMYKYWKVIEQNCTNLLGRKKCLLYSFFYLIKQTLVLLTFGYAAVRKFNRKEGKITLHSGHILYCCSSLAPQPISVLDLHKNGFLGVSKCILLGIIKLKSMSFTSFTIAKLSMDIGHVRIQVNILRCLHIFAFTFHAVCISHFIFICDIGDSLIILHRDLIKQIIVSKCKHPKEVSEDCL